MRWWRDLRKWRFLLRRAPGLRFALGDRPDFLRGGLLHFTFRSQRFSRCFFELLFLRLHFRRFGHDEQRLTTGAAHAPANRLLLHLHLPSAVVTNKLDAHEPASFSTIAICKLIPSCAAAAAIRLISRRRIPFSALISTAFLPCAAARSTLLAICVIWSSASAIGEPLRSSPRWTNTVLQSGPASTVITVAVSRSSGEA